MRGAGAPTSMPTSPKTKNPPFWAKYRLLDGSWIPSTLEREQEKSMSLSIHPLDLGDLEVDASFVNWQTGCGTNFWVPTTAWLIQGAERPILVDSSFRSVEDALSNQGLTARRSQQQTLEYQLGKHGLKPGDIGYLLHTHVHMDHAGQDILLPNAKILLQRRELQHASAPNIYPVPFYDRLNVARLVNDLWNRVEILDGEMEPFPGIRCVPMPGHTPGHQAIYVATQSGTAIVCGDAAMNVAVNVDKQVPPGYLDNMADVMSGLRKLQREGKHILPTHDPDVFSKYPNGVA
jgi:N-acyl homoserine lactone hydrolase